MDPKHKPRFQALIYVQCQLSVTTKQGSSKLSENVGILEKSYVRGIPGYDIVDQLRSVI